MTITRKQRIDTLKTLGKLANHYLQYYKKLSNLKTKTWIDKKAENSILQLKEIISKINADLHPKKVEAYCKPMPSIKDMSVGDFLSNSQSKENLILSEHLSEIFGQTNINFTLFEIARHAPEQNIIHDITWLSDGTISDYVELALGNKKIEYFEKFLLPKIEEIEKIILPHLKDQPFLVEKIKVIEEAIRMTKSGNFLSSNILLITVTESIVRLVAHLVYKNQNPELSAENINEYVYDKFTSIDNLISKGNWQNDFPINLSEAVILYRDVNEANLNSWRQKFYQHRKSVSKIRETSSSLGNIIDKLKSSEEEDVQGEMLSYLERLEEHMQGLLREDEYKIKINLTVMLNFLVRKYKDDRNLIIHGNFEEFNHRWKNYINYSALWKVFDVYKNYKELYEK